MSSTVFIVWHGDGYGHNRIEAAYKTEEAARAHADKAGGGECGYTVYKWDVKDWPDKICGVCGHLPSEHTAGHTRGGTCFCGCQHFVKFPARVPA